mmetsp:Transcript_44063/g.89968  ORF Transcript_44063/g.89968 Transcript_44063/m.89968 type:complete len:85 (+) Transcript_44063:339-593(+)
MPALAATSRFASKDSHEGSTCNYVSGQKSAYHQTATLRMLLRHEVLLLELGDERPNVVHEGAGLAHRRLVHLHDSELRCDIDTE